MKAPFVWFGGKRRVANIVWDAIGDVDNYAEPFAGSLAVLLERPHNMRDGKRRAETINDKDSYVANFWRALSADPEAVARWCDWPVNETDLFARHLWLVNTGRDILVANLEADPDWYDAKIAGWWVWGINAWIGSGWCSGTGPWRHADDEPDDEGNRKRPHLGDAGRGVNRQLPHLGTAGQGVNRQLPHLGDAGQAGYNNLEHRLRPGEVLAYLEGLAGRLRDVRVCCGDWSRVVTKGALSFGSTVGVFVDPPYLGDVRTRDLYATDDHHIANDVRDWCIANGDNPRLRIVLAGYEPEHDHLIPPTWRRHRWSSSAAYSTTTSAERLDGNHANRHKEVLWISPHCVNREPDLFGGAL
jgi:DNA adenine methylase